MASTGPLDQDLHGVPEANRPGHHPRREQDKPEGAPPAPRSVPATFPFLFTEPFARAAWLLGVRPSNAVLTMDEERLRVRFGFWTLETPLRNVAYARVTGPYRWWKVIGPPRLSLVDRGLTFATTDRRGLCIQFHEPVASIVPGSLLRHPAVTATAAEVDLALAELRRRADRWDASAR